MHTFGERSRAMLPSESEREHIAQTLRDLLTFYGIFRNVSYDRLDLGGDAFRQHDTPRVERLALLNLFGGHRLARLLPSPVLPREGARRTMGLFCPSVLAGAHEPLGSRKVVGRIVGPIFGHAPPVLANNVVGIHACSLGGELYTVE